MQTHEGSLNGFVVWFTGLSGAGKSTLATLLAAELRGRGVHVEILDGDEVRAHLSKGLGFSREDRDTSVRRVGFVAKLVARSGACAMTAAISPYRDTRDEQRAAIGRFVEVFCRCSIDTLTDRDPKGLYKKALAGEIENFTGVSDPYEEPLNPEVVVDTGTTAPIVCVAQVLEKLEELGYLVKRAAPDRALAPPWGREVVDVANTRTLKEPIGSIDIDAETAMLCAAVSFGTLSPMRGPLNEKDARKVASEWRIESGLPWPFRWVLPHDGFEVDDVVALTSPTGARWPLYVSEIWKDDEGVRYLAGEVLGNHPREVDAVRDRIAREGHARAAAFLVRRPLDAEELCLLNIALEAKGQLVMMLATQDPDAIASVRDFAARERREGHVFLVDLPALPYLPPERDPLLQVIVARNIGLCAVVLDARQEQVADSVPPRDTFRRWRDVEVGIEIVASGPVTRSREGGFKTRRAEFG